METNESGAGRVEVMDLYLASYYVLRGCELAEVRCIPTAKTVSCGIVVKGDEGLIRAVREEYFEKRASVNLWDFRGAYNQVNSSVHQAKKSWDRAKRSGVVGGSGGGV